MPKRSRQVLCTLCESESRYTCPKCSILYCSLNCYKLHEERCTGFETKSNNEDSENKTKRILQDSNRDGDQDGTIEDESPLKPLTALKWPYIPEEPSFQDPLTAHDPKPLKLSHYESIASSSSIRKVLNKEGDELRALLTRIDSLRGSEREEALQYLLGVPDPSKKNRIPKAILDSADHDSLESFKQFSEAVRISIEKAGGADTGLVWEGQSTE